MLYRSERGEEHSQQGKKRRYWYGKQEDPTK